MAEIKIPQIKEFEIPSGDFPFEDGVPHSGYMRTPPNVPKPTGKPGGQKPSEQSPSQEKKEKKDE